VGVTEITSIGNYTGFAYAVRNIENPNDTGGNEGFLHVAQGEKLEVNMWIPWCNNATDYGWGKKIAFEALGTLPERPGRPPDSFTVWQQGAHVYFSLDDQFGTGQLVLGKDDVDGRRTVEIEEPGRPRFY
jgi:hypothetical protein